MNETTKNLERLRDKIKECMIRNQKLGGRYTLEINTDEAEQIMFLATNEHHNSQCAECGMPVSCVCTKSSDGCNHIWYCPDHVLNHKHRQMEIDDD